MTWRIGPAFWWGLWTTPIARCANVAAMAMRKRSPGPKGAALLALGVLTLRSFVFAPFYIPSESMPRAS